MSGLRLRVPAVLAIVAVLTVACAPTTDPSQNVYRPQVTPTATEWTLDAPKNEVIDAALNLAQQANLVVRVLDRQSGLIDFEAATLDAALLDDYCHYPLVDVSGTPIDTFRGWHSRSVNGGAGPVVGVITVSVLVTPLGQQRAQMRIRTNFETYNSLERSACQGTGQFDNIAVQGIRALLADDSAKVEVGIKNR